jgi:hypothetical protein
MLEKPLLTTFLQRTSRRITEATPWVSRLSHLLSVGLGDTGIGAGVPWYRRARAFPHSLHVILAACSSSRLAPVGIGLFQARTAQFALRDSLIMCNSMRLGLLSIRYVGIKKVITYFRSVVSG